MSITPLSQGGTGVNASSDAVLLTDLGAASLTADNSFTGQQTFSAAVFLKPATGSNVTPRVMSGRNGGFVDGIDGAASVPSRDFAFGRIEQVTTGDDFDYFYIQHNAQTTTLTSSVSAGATSLPIAAALTFTGTDGSGNYWVTIGDNTTGNIQEAVQITAGRGTTTMTCVALANPHPSGARVTVGYDLANQPTTEFTRVGSAASSNKNWNVTIRPDVTGSQPGLGALKLEIPPSPGLTADYFEVAARDESQKAFLIQNDYAVSIESSPTDWTDSSAATHSNTTVNLSITPSGKMYGCFITGAGIPRGTYITGFSTGAGTVTISTAATATASGVSVYIYKPSFQVRDLGSSGSLAYRPRFSVLGNGTFVARGKMIIGGGSNLGPGPTADLFIGGTLIYMNGGGAYPDFQIALDTASGGSAHLQIWEENAVNFCSSGGNAQLSFYSATPVSQPSTTGTTAGFTSGGTNAAYANSTFTGNTGTTAYTIGDIVNALKKLGLMAA